MTPGLAIIAAVILTVGVILPVVSMIVDESKRYPSIYGAGAARLYLAELVRRSELESWEFARGGVSAPPWVVFNGSGNRTDDEKWKANMVAAVAAIAPDDVTISDAGTCIRMTPK